MDASMWEPEQVRPLGVSEAEWQRLGRPEQGTGAGVSPENGSVDGNNHSPGTEPPARPLLSPDDDAKLREAVMRLRWQQPEEWDVYSKLATMEKQAADMLAVVELQSELVLRLATKIEALQSKLAAITREAA